MKIKISYKLFFTTFYLATAISVPVYAGDSIAGFGRIIPSGGMLNLAPTSNEPIERILVSEGDNVLVGNELAYLNSRKHHEIEIGLAKSEIVLAEIAHNEAILNREFDIQSQKIRVTSLREKYNSAKERLASLFQNEAEKYISPDTIKERKSEIHEFKTEYNLSNLSLEKLQKSLDLAIKKTDKKLEVAKQKLKLAEQKLSQSIIYSPIDGKIMKIFGKPGENAGKVIFKIADLDKKYVITEIYESDALRLEVGQKAKITSTALPAEISGVVISVGTMIFKNTVDSLDSAAQTNSRVIEALILLDENPYAEKMINLQVDVLIYK